jgi:saccharopine dehydrogenase-like NADP-dependent oxidoreductase
VKKILLFGAGKSATSLIRFLIRETAARIWQLVVVDSNLALAQSKVDGAPGAWAVSIRVEDREERERLVQEADIVISLLPPSLHQLVAQSCLELGRTLLTASYLDPAMKALGDEIRRKGLLFICELGLDPGIDHMSALQMISRIRKTPGTRIVSFRSHTGGLVAPGSDDNPWHYKISWNPRNVVTAGSAGAKYKEDGRTVIRDYTALFGQPGQTSIPGLGNGPMAWYPNRDSLAYIPLYQLDEAETFVRTTLRYPQFCQGWDPLVKAQLTDDKTALSDQYRLISEWSSPVLPYVNDSNRDQLAYLGLFDQVPIPPGARTSADILQHLLETRLAMKPGDRDMIVMQHEIQFEVRGILKEAISTLVVIGDDNLETAMAKTVGWPLGIASLLILEGKLKLTGLHIPILPEIYVPVLQELERLGICFVETMPVS